MDSDRKVDLHKEILSSGHGKNEAQTLSYF